MTDETDWLELLQMRIARLTRSFRAEFSVYARFVDEGVDLALDADRQRDTMSMIKVPLLVALMRAVEAGRISLADPVVLKEDDKRQGSGVLLLFDAGARFTLKDAVWLMIVISDNSATDICLAAVGGIAVVNQTMADLGIAGIEMVGDTLAWFRALGQHVDPKSVGRSPGEMVRAGWPKLGPGGLEAAMADYHFGDGAAFGFATARALGALYEQILFDRCARAETCAQIRTFLEGQQLKDRLPKFGFGLDGAHKSGSFPPFIANDGGIFTTAAGARVILVVLTRGFAGERALLDDALGRIGELVFQAADARAGCVRSGGDGAGSRT